MSEKPPNEPPGEQATRDAVAEDSRLVHARMPMGRRDRAAGVGRGRVGIGKLFHLAHLVEDLEMTDRLYEEVFAAERIYHDYERFGRRTASLNIVADQCLEPVWPTSDPADAHRPLQRFKSRFGNRLHSIAWYVEDIEAFTQHLLDRGIRVLSLAGKPVTQAAGAEAIWTHIADTGALLEFCEDRYVDDPRLRADYDKSRWIEHPLGITHTSHVTVLVEDLGHARRVYGDALMGERISLDTTDPSRPREYFAIGSETVIDAVAPTTDNTPEGADRAAAGAGVHSVTFATVDLDRAVGFLASKCIGVTREGEHQVWLDLDPGHGIRIGMTDSPVVPAA